MLFWLKSISGLHFTHPGTDMYHSISNNLLVDTQKTKAQSLLVNVGYAFKENIFASPFIIWEPLSSLTNEVGDVLMDIYLHHHCRHIVATVPINWSSRWSLESHTYHHHHYCISLDIILQTYLVGNLDKERLLVLAMYSNTRYFVHPCEVGSIWPSRKKHIESVIYESFYLASIFSTSETFIGLSKSKLLLANIFLPCKPALNIST